MSESRLPFDLGELFRRIDSARQESAQSWASVSQQVGVAVSTIRRFAIAADAEANGALALVRWLGVAPEEFMNEGSIPGLPLPPANGGFIRVDNARIAEVSRIPGGATGIGRTSIQRLAKTAQAAGRPIVSFTRWSPI
jgi:hypothetical protein